MYTVASFLVHVYCGLCGSRSVCFLSSIRRRGHCQWRSWFDRVFHDAHCALCTGLYSFSADIGATPNNNKKSLDRHPFSMLCSRDGNQRFPRPRTRSCSGAGTKGGHPLCESLFRRCVLVVSLLSLLRAVRTIQKRRRAGRGERLVRS